MLRLFSKDQRAVDQYLRARAAASKMKPPPALTLAKVKGDELLATLQPLCGTGTEGLAVAQPWPIEEDFSSTFSRSGTVDAAFPCRALSSQGDRSRYEQTSRLFVFLHTHDLSIESGYEVILKRDLHVAFHYADGWGMDCLSLYYFLTSVGQDDLAALVEGCRKINDVCWLVKEAASRDKQSAYMYWPLSRLYTGKPDPFAKKHRRKYHELIMRAEELPHFVEKIVPPPPPVTKSSASSVAKAVTEATRTSKRRKKMTSGAATTPEGSTIPSFEEFVSQHTGSVAPSDDAQTAAFPSLEPGPCVPRPVETAPATVPVSSLIPQQAELSNPAGDVLIPPETAKPGEALPPVASPLRNKGKLLPSYKLLFVSSFTTFLSPSTIRKRAAVKSVVRRAKRPLHTIRVSSRASARLVLAKIRRGGREPSPVDPKNPVAISSGSSEGSQSPYSSDEDPEAGGVGEKQAKEKIAALEGIEDDSSSSVAASPTASAEQEVMMSAELAPESGPDIPASKLQPAVSLEPLPEMAVVSYEPPLEKAPRTLAKPALKSSDPPIEASPDDDSCASVLPVTFTPVGNGAVSSELAATPTATVGVQDITLADDTAARTALPSSSHDVDISLWSDVDALVHFEVPPVVSSGVVSSFDAILKLQMSVLRSTVSQNPDISYGHLKHIADGLTGVLAFMGCPLAGWSERVIMLLKFVRRRQYLTALEVQESEYQAVSEPLQASREQHRSVIAKLSATSGDLKATVARLEAELAAAKAELDGVIFAREQAEEALLLSEGEAASAEEKVKEIQAQKSHLKERVSSLYLGILPLEDIFRDFLEVADFCSTVGVTAFYSTVGVTAFYSTVRGLLLSQITAFYFTARVAAFYSTVGVTAFYSAVRDVKALAQFADVLIGAGYLSLLMLLHFAMHCRCSLVLCWRNSWWDFVA
ncbi:hypothetical protein Taro_014864 [Colocasia esculenta]|uniref:Uncharacterized protein n=1 Tax=Colocasia esculenta TaxID=4460 RepID=A0A843UG45_COLES|nr:hypothetical protein [Colocasia esculenta]